MAEQNAPMDLRALLDVPVDSIKKPANWPAGPYHGFIEKYEPGTSREKKTPYLRVFVRITRAGDSIPQDLLKDANGDPIDVSKRQFRKDYYLTDDAKWRLVEMIQKVGVETEGKSLGSCIPELVTKPVLVQLGLRANEQGTEMFNELQDIVADVQS